MKTIIMTLAALSLSLFSVSCVTTKGSCSSCPTDKKACCAKDGKACTKECTSAESCSQ